MCIYIYIERERVTRLSAYSGKEKQDLLIGSADSKAPQLRFIPTPII